MDEPNYQITDSSGTVVGEIGADANGDPVVSKPGGGEVIITDDGVRIPGDAEVDGLFSTEDVNSILYNPDRGNFSTSADFQSFLDSISAGTSNQRTVVSVKPGSLLDSFSIPENTIIYLNGSQVRPNSDPGSGNAIVDASAFRAILIGPGRISAQHLASFSGDAYRIDSAGLGNALRFDDDQEVPLADGPAIEIAGDGVGGTAVRIKADGNAIDMGGKFNFNILGFDDQLVLDTANGAYINGLEFDIQGERYTTKSIRHINSAGAAGEAKVLIDGVIQTESGHVIHNETSVNGSVRYDGQIWDPTAATTAVEGPGIRIETTNNLSASNISFGVGTVVNQTGQEALAGSPPNAGSYRVGDVIEDTDNPGTLYKLTANGAWVTI
ncbi:hypothetical protein [Halorubrum halodurans]|uniref:hypothetical protein n=1 Tax=Halorubrum halodurans TaxID=1383851 RepID=UPI00117B0337|nr:hypothetical protein [Halorubrum halodurans]